MAKTEFNIITAADIGNKGVIGLPDTPGLETEEMQKKFEEVVRDVVIVKFNEFIDKLNEQFGTDITDIGDGTVTGAISSLNGRLSARPVFLSETSGTGQSIELDLLQYRYILVNVIAGSYAIQAIVSPGIVNNLTKLGIQTQIGLQTSSGYSYVNFLYDNNTFTWASGTTMIVDIYGIK